jgi:hypothetical protein
LAALAEIEGKVAALFDRNLLGLHS